MPGIPSYELRCACHKYARFMLMALETAVTKVFSWRDLDDEHTNSHVNACTASIVATAN